MTHFEKTRELVDGIPHMGVAQAERLREHMAAFRPDQVLELGFAHGVSTCYMASVLEDLGAGHVTTIDLERAKRVDPNIEMLLDRTGLRRRVTVYYEPTGYNWRLMKMLQSDPQPRFDLCYLDGAHTWVDDGLAFFLVDRLLNPGGWIIFDDLNWSFSQSPSLMDSEWVRALPAEQRQAPQVRHVFDLLVKTHPAYGEIRIEGEWGFARKVVDAGAVAMRTVTEVKPVEVGLGAAVLRVGRALIRRLAGRP